MADFVFNVSKGRVNELVRRVKNGDPSTSRLKVIVFLASALPAQGTLEDCATVAAITSAGATEATNTGYARKTLTASDLTLPAPDNTNNWQTSDIPDQRWTAPAVSPGAWGLAVVCYEVDNGSPSDSTLVPMTAHTFAPTPDAVSDIVLEVNASGFYKAS